MDERSIVTAYRRLAKRYDSLFGPVFEPGRKLSIAKMACRPGDHILEVGVSTRLSLPHYPQDVTVDGIYLSPDMLAHARWRINGAAERITLQVMDAQALAFGDDRFDKVVAMYVASVVPDPQLM